MAVLKIVESWKDRTADITPTELKAKRGYTVEFDDEDDPVVRPLMAYWANDGTTAIPNIYDSHPYDSRVYCESKHVDTIGPFLYKVMVNYTSPLSKDTGLPVTPLLVEPRWTWTFATSNEPFDRDEDGNPITNSADEAFDPPVTKDYHDLVLHIERSEAAFDPLKAYQYKGAINSDIFLGFPAGRVLCAIWNGDKAQAGDLIYYKVAYEFHIRFDGWKMKLIDKGFREKDGENPDGTPAYIPITNKDGTISSQPALLNGSGKKLTQAQITAGDLSILEFTINRSLPFSVMNL